MSDYISRKEVIKLIQARYENPEICIEEVNRIPSVNAEPVVRCGECKYYESPNGFCGLNESYWDRNNFCSYGVKKDDGQEGKTMG